MILKPFKAINRRLQRRIQNRLLIAMFLLFVLAFSALGAVSLFFGRDAVSREVIAHNNETAATISAETDTFFNDVVSNLQLVAQQITQGFSLFNSPNNKSNSMFDPSNPTASPLSIIGMIGLKKLSNEPYQLLSLLDKDGKQVFVADSVTGISTSVPYAGIRMGNSPADFSKDPTYLVPKSGQVYISKMNWRNNSTQSYITVSVPVLDLNNNFVGAVMAEVTFQDYVQSTFTIFKSTDTMVTLVADDGQVVGSSHPQVASQMNFEQNLSSSLSSGKNSTTATTSTTIEGADHEMYLVSCSPLKSLIGWRVIVSQSYSKAFGVIQELTVPTLVSLFLAILLCSILIVFVAKTITRPIRELASTANQITTTGNLDKQIPITSQDEVGELTAAFNGMILGLRKTREALEHWNRELGNKVEERTHELTEINVRLELANGELEAANLHKSQFLANMSHELRTPLNAIIGFGEVLQDQVFGDLNAKQARYVDNIVNSGRHLLNLVNDVLDLSKVEAGKMELHLEEISSRQVINEVQVQLGELAARKKLQLEVKLAADLDIIMVDRARYRQILFNLLSNAIKFTPDGGQIIMGGEFVTQADSAQSSQAVFRVADTGIGISPENQARIFDSFQQVDSSYSRQFQGTGLGLALTRSLVEMHDGKIWVESEMGKGSCFYFTMPLAAPVAPEKPFSPDDVFLPEGEVTPVI